MGRKRALAPLVRKFGKRQYARMYIFHRKDFAQHRAEAMRRQGFLARVIGGEVWVAKR